MDRRRGPEAPTHTQPPEAGSSPESRLGLGWQVHDDALKFYIVVRRNDSHFLGLKAQRPNQGHSSKGGSIFLRLNR